MNAQSQNGNLDYVEAPMSPLQSGIGHTSVSGQRRDGGNAQHIQSHHQSAWKAGVLFYVFFLPNENESPTSSRYTLRPLVSPSELSRTISSVYAMRLISRIREHVPFSVHLFPTTVSLSPMSNCPSRRKKNSPTWPRPFACIRSSFDRYFTLSNRALYIQSQTVTYSTVQYSMRYGRIV